MLRSFVNLGIENSIEGGRTRWTSARVCFHEIFGANRNYFRIIFEQGKRICFLRLTKTGTISANKQ